MITLTASSANLVNTIIEQLAGLSPAASYFVIGYLLARQLIPVLLIVFAGRSATPTQRISLVRDYLLHPSARTKRGSETGPSGRRPAPSRRQRGS